MNMRPDYRPIRRWHVVDDLRRFSGRSSHQQLDVTSVTGILRKRAAVEADLERDAAVVQSRGDGELLRLAEGATAQQVVTRYPLALLDSLRKTNGDRSADAQIQLRLAVVDGYSELTADGVLVGTAPVRAVRLVDSVLCRKALELAPPHCPLVVIVDHGVYTGVIQEQLVGSDPAEWVKVLVEDTAKGFEETAWLTVPGLGPDGTADLADRLSGPPSQHERDNRASGEPPPRDPSGSPPAPRPAASAEGGGNRRTADEPVAPDVPRPGGEPDDRRGTGRRPGWLPAVVVALIGAIGAILAAVLPSALSDDEAKSPAGESPSAAAPHTGSANPSGPGSAGVSPTGTSTESARRTWKEIADRNDGVPVFSSASGANAEGRNRIPLGTEVPVSCVAVNRSGMASVNAWYVIADGPWKGLYAPANTFANGDPVGEQGGTHTIDVAVPRCSET
ncbi:hypothetical protein ABZ478_05355 [Streptomyces sp. NPDC005706]|uniref:hypothetical protein n=1 Tax=Streptomyces sp. NPDC005706 TaxID=3157169 RepID=UPI0033CCF358